jgi:hypothetical protein
MNLGVITPGLSASFEPKAYLVTEVANAASRRDTASFALRAESSAPEAASEACLADASAELAACSAAEASESALEAAASARRLFSVITAMLGPQADNAPTTAKIPSTPAHVFIRKTSCTKSKLKFKAECFRYQPRHTGKSTYLWQGSAKTPLIVCKPVYPLRTGFGIGRDKLGLFP